MVDLAHATLFDIFEGWSAAIVAVVTLCSLPPAVLTLRNQRRDMRRQRSYDYVQRLYDIEFAGMNTRVLIFLQTGDATAFEPSFALSARQGKTPSEEEKRAAYDGLTLDQANKVTLVLNFYEEMSGSYRKKLLAPEVADTMLLPVAVAAWPYAKWLIDYLREGLEDRYDEEVAEATMDEWQWLVENAADGARERPIRERLEAFFGSLSKMLVPIAGVLAVLGLLTVALAADSFRDVAACFLFASAFVCLILGAAAFAQQLSPSPARSAALVAASLVATLSIGVTGTLALTASTGPPGSPGSPGKNGRRGEQGPSGKRGPTGKRGEGGEPGAPGKRGPRGEVGPRGPHGPRGRRGRRGLTVPEES